MDPALRGLGVCSAYRFGDEDACKTSKQLRLKPVSILGGGRDNAVIHKIEGERQILCR